MSGFRQLQDGNMITFEFPPSVFGWLEMAYAGDMSGI